MMKKIYFLIAGCLFSMTPFEEAHCQSSVKKEAHSQFQNFISIPMAGNSWVVNTSAISHKIVTPHGIEGWNDLSDRINIFFRTEMKGKVQIAIRAKIKSGRSKIRCQIGETTKKISIGNSTSDTIKIGTFNIKDTGYQKITFIGTGKTSESFGEISDLLICGEAINDQVRFVKDDFYYGRRGPSVHLNYELPKEVGDVEWFYNEITVPDGNDIVGSYFMANGFAEGYFGIQVNSSSERRILFSVWSPYKTDKPGNIPEDQRIILLKKGQDVHAGVFGNEGSGGQSYRIFPWKSGTTYRFLLKGSPSENNSTDYTAWFYAPETGKWELIAGFRRPKTTTSLKRLHSFLENFMPENGNISRKGIYSNQWVCNTSGIWTPITEARFSADATARKEARLDYAGGIEKDGFFLKNCGFFNEKTDIGARLIHPGMSDTPKIDLSVLP